MSICKSGVKGYQAQAVPFSPIRVLTLLRLPPLPPSPLLIHSFPILAGPAHPRANKSSSQLELALALTPTLPHLFFFFLFSLLFSLDGRRVAKHWFRFQQQQSASAFPFSVHVFRFLSAFSAPVIPRPVPARSSPFSRRIFHPPYLLRQSGTRKKQLRRLPFFRLFAWLRPRHPRRLSSEPQSGKPGAGKDVAQTDAHPSTRRCFALPERYRERSFVLIRDRRHFNVPIALRTRSIPFCPGFCEPPPPPPSAPTRLTSSLSSSASTPTSRSADDACTWGIWKFAWSRIWGPWTDGHGGGNRPYFGKIGSERQGRYHHQRI